MRILVFGAGVLGCNLTRNLFRAGKDVTLLARGSWAETIRKNGLRIKDKFSPRMSVSRVPVVTELKPDDAYDVIFVVMRYTQLDAIMETLQTSAAKNIVFVGNNVRASAVAARLPEKNVMFAFASSAGHIRCGRRWNRKPGNTWADAVDSTSEKPKASGLTGGFFSSYFLVPQGFRSLLFGQALTPR